MESSGVAMMDHFFGADCWRVLENLRDTDAISHYRDSVHPYFSLFAVSVSKLGSVSVKEGAEFLLYRSVFGTLGVFFFWLLILFETDKPLIAFSAVLLLLSTFTVKVWSVLPDTFIFGFFTLMLSLNLIRVKADVLPVFIVSLSGATTNAFLGLVYLARRFSLSKEFFRKLLCIAFCVAILSLLQKMLYPSSIHFFDISAMNEERVYFNRTITSIPFRLFDFIYSGFVIPLPNGAAGNVVAEELWRTFFRNAADGYGKWVIFGVVLTLTLVPLLFVISIYRFARDSGRSEVSIVILMFIVFQCLLHMIYGDTPFLYSYHFLPMMVLFLALQLPRNMITVAVMIGFSVILQQIQGAQLERFILIFRQ